MKSARIEKSLCLGETDCHCSRKKSYSQIELYFECTTVKLIFLLILYIIHIENILVEGKTYLMGMKNNYDLIAISESAELDFSHT